jgi:hypothetical protein
MRFSTGLGEYQRCSIGMHSKHLTQIRVHGRQLRAHHSKHWIRDELIIFRYCGQQALAMNLFLPQKLPIIATLNLFLQLAKQLLRELIQIFVNGTI